MWYLHHLGTSPTSGSHPQGLVPNDRWQMDVTHFPAFGKLKYIHVTVDTFTGFLYASPLTGEASRDVRIHILQCVSVMPRPPHRIIQWTGIYGS